jgi:hypothetical protein
MLLSHRQSDSQGIFLFTNFFAASAGGCGGLRRPPVCGPQRSWAVFDKPACSNASVYSFRGGTVIAFYDIWPCLFDGMDARSVSAKMQITVSNFDRLERRR